jgi:hypothetical protein
MRIYGNYVVKRTEKNAESTCIEKRTNRTKSEKKESEEEVEKRGSNNQFVKMLTRRLNLIKEREKKRGTK